MFHDFAARGDVGLSCLGERCAYCAMERYCAAIRTKREELRAGGIAQAEIDLTTTHAVTTAFVAALRQAALERVVLHAPDAESAERFVASVWPKGAPPLVLHLAALTHMVGALPPALARSAARLVLADPSEVDAARAFLAAHPALDVEIRAHARTLSLIESLATAGLPLARVVVAVANHDRLTKVEAEEVSPTTLSAALRTLPPGAVRVRNLPPCLTGGQRADTPAWPLPTLAPGVVDDHGLIEPFGFAEHFIRMHYYAQSLRCAACVHHATCPGLHINALRAFGFRVLTPIRDFV